MCKRPVYLISLVLTLTAVGISRADTIAYWRFDDVGDPVIDSPAGTVAADNPMPDSDGQNVWRKAAHDHSGNGNHLTTWEHAWAGFNWSSDVPAGSLPLTGAANTLSMASAGDWPAAMTWSEQSLPSGVDLETIAPAAFTIEASFKAESLSGFTTIVGRDDRYVASANGDLAALYFQVTPNREVAFKFTDAGGYFHEAISPANVVTPGEWYNMAGVSDGSTLSLYLNNDLVAQVDLTASGSTNTSMVIGSSSGGDWESGTWTVGRGLYAGGHVDRWYGYIDEVRISDTALEVSEFLFTPVYAGNPVPGNNSLHQDLYATLQWSAGVFAASHDVYFSDNYDDVATRAGSAFQDNLPLDTTFLTVGLPDHPYPDGLETGKTYYWRVDEVNDLHPDSPWMGEVWNFTVPSKKAYKPVPADGARFVDTSPTLSWTPGHGAALHYVYFGDNAADVEAGTGGTDKGQVPGTSFLPGTLELEKTYYWRVDEFDNLGELHKGDVWSFETIPAITVTDPNLVGWWTFDEGAGSTALDWSGHENHGTLIGNPEWVAGYDGEAVRLDGVDDYVNLPIGPTIASLGSTTITTWVDFSNAGGAWQRIFDFGSNTTAYMFLTPRLGTGGEMRFAITAEGGGDPEQMATAPGTLASGWHHVAVTINAETPAILLYLDGVVVASNSDATLTPSDLGNTTNNWLGRSQYSGDAYFNGSLDDFRIYNYALTADEIPNTMRGDPLRAWNPRPANGSTPGTGQAAPLTWSPGEQASEHDVYFGTDRTAVEDADASTAGIYRGRQGGTSYTPPEGVEWGGGPYYWRIDQYNTDGTITEGRVWSFTVADFIAVDDFEDYKGDEVPVTEQIWGKWRDGLGFGAPLAPPYYPGNGTGSEIGDVTTDSYTEESITHAGSRQSMPYWFNNNKQDKFKYSEAKLTLTDVRNWTAEDVKALSLWFTGYPASVGSFAVAGNTYTMTASGADIWDLTGLGEGFHDEFHFAYKQLTGSGTIIVRVESVSNTDAWAKAGVMIRETLEPGSKHAFAYITPGNGVASQGRTETAGPSFSTNQTGITAPHWLRLERSIAGDFTVSHSADGSAWEPVTGTAPENIQMNSNVYVGLALTSHNTNATCEGVFSSVQISANVTGQWMHQDIGITSNAAEPMYVAVANSIGPPAVVYHDDPDATTIDTWTEWNIDLKDFQDQGINLADVNSIAIGFGDRDNPVAGGWGKMFFDDIRLYRARYVPGKGTPLSGDISDDGVVDMADLEIMSQDWLLTDDFVATTPPGTAGLVGHWPLDGNANDTSGRGNNGMPNGGLQWIPAGQISGAAELDGVNDYINLPIGGIINSLSDCCLATWVNWSGQGGAWQRIFDFGSDQTSYMFLAPSPLRFAITTNGGGAESQLNAPEPLTTGWHHVAVTIDSASMNMTLYVDGVAVATATTANLPAALGATTQNWLGRSQYAVDPYFEGSLDDLRIYNRSLSAAQIAYLADTTPGDGQLYVPVPSAGELHEAEPQGSRSVNFRDFAILVSQWLEEQLWPEW